MSDIAYHSEENGRAAQRETEGAFSMDNVRPLPRISVHAFCENEGVFKIMERCASDRRLSKVNMRITQGGISAAVSTFQSTSTPNLLFLETNGGYEHLMADLEPLAEVCDPSTKVVIIGQHNDVALYRDLIRNGISEYIVAPVSIADIVSTMSEIFVDPDAAPLGKSIAFVGAKGGVGSSTIAHNVAWGISELFEEGTIIADLDLAFGTANINFDQDPTQGISEAVFAPERLDETFLDRLLTKCSEHLSLLAAPSLLDKVYDFEGSAFTPIVDVLQRTAPVTVLDVPHTWSDWTRNILTQVDDVVVTATPDLANLRNTKNLFDELRKIRPNDKAPHLILNQVGMPKRPEIAPMDFCDPLEAEPIAILPFDIALFGSAANSGRMIGEMETKSPIIENLSQIAHIVTGRIEVKKRKKAGIAGLMSIIGRKNQS